MPRLGSVTASMETVVRPLETETQPGLLLSDYDDVDFHALFSTSSEYALDDCTGVNTNVVIVVICCWSSISKRSRVNCSKRHKTLRS